MGVKPCRNWVVTADYLSTVLTRLNQSFHQPHLPFTNPMFYSPSPFTSTSQPHLPFTIPIHQPRSTTPFTTPPSSFEYPHSPTPIHQPHSPTQFTTPIFLSISPFTIPHSPTPMHQPPCTNLHAPTPAVDLDRVDPWQPPANLRRSTGSHKSTTGLFSAA